MPTVYELARKNAKQARYRGNHKKLKAALDPLVQTGTVECWRCSELIEPGPWDLGHDDLNPELHAGPEHTWCNRGAHNRLVHSREW